MKVKINSHNRKLFPLIPSGLSLPEAVLTRGGDALFNFFHFLFPLVISTPQPVFFIFSFLADSSLQSWGFPATAGLSHYFSVVLNFPPSPPAVFSSYSFPYLFSNSSLLIFAHIRVRPNSREKNKGKILVC